MQVGVELVLGVASTIVVKAVDLATDMLARVFHRAARTGVGAVATALIDVVAVAVDEVEVLLRRLAVGGVKALLIGLAAQHAEARLCGRGTGGRRGLGPPAGGPFAAGTEAVEILAGGLQPLDLDMDRMGQFGAGHGLAGANHGFAETARGRDLPFHRHRGRGHAVTDLHRARREAGPDDEAVGGRVTGRDPELEGIFGEHRNGERLTARAGEGTAGAKGQQQTATGQGFERAHRDLRTG